MIISDSTTLEPVFNNGKIITNVERHTYLDVEFNNKLDIDLMFYMDEMKVKRCSRG